MRTAFGRLIFAVHIRFWFLHQQNAVMPYRRSYRRRTTRRKYPYRKRKRRSSAATTVQRAVRSHFRRRKAKRIVRRIYRRRANRRANSLYTATHVETFKCLLPKRAVPVGNYFTDDLNITGDEGVLCGQASVSDPGLLQVALTATAGGFFDSTATPNNFKAFNDRVLSVMKQYKSYRVMSTTFSFTPFNSGRGLLDMQEQSLPSVQNSISALSYKNLFLWSVIDNGQRHFEPTELVGSLAWKAPLPGPGPALNFSGHKYSISSSDSVNICDKSVKCRYVSSTDKKGFSITVYPPKKMSPLWQIKEIIRTTASIPTDYMRPGGWYHCADWEDFQGNAWLPSPSPEGANYAAFGGVQLTPPLSIGLRLNQRLDSTGSPEQIPWARVIVSQKIMFKGKLAIPE